MKKKPNEIMFQCQSTNFQYTQIMAHVYTQIAEILFVREIDKDVSLLVSLIIFVKEEKL